QRGGRGVVGEATLLAADRGDAQAKAAERLRHSQLQVAGLPERREVFAEEPVLAVIAGARAAQPSSSSWLSTGAGASAVVMAVISLPSVRRSSAVVRRR